MHSIMVATNFSARAVNASHRAAHVANAVAADAIELLHVLPARSRLGRSMRQTEVETGAVKLPTARLSAIRDVVQTMTNAWVDARIVHGRFVEAVVSASQRTDLLVVGASHTMSWLRPLIGSTLALTRRVRVPILIVRESPGYPYRRVLMAVDLVTAADRALAAARMIAPGARFDVVHAYRAAFESKLQFAGVAPDVVADLRADAGRDALLRIADLVSSSPALPAPTAHVIHGHATSRVLAKARELAPDLIVVSKSAKTRIEEWLVPGMTSGLLESASADVLVIPP
jgi:nucleotide-binding universal stress UspA family protein